MTAMHVSAQDDSGLATAINAAYPGWRAWRTRDGDLAARKGGSPAVGAHACGGSLAELTRAIEAAITAGPPPVLRPTEQAALDVLGAAAAPLRVRTVVDTSGLHISTTATALASFHSRDLAPGAATGAAGSMGLRHEPHHAWARARTGWADGAGGGGDGGRVDR